MEYPAGKRPWTVYALIGFELLYGVMGIISGLILMSDPSGAGLGFTPEIRDDIPFQSFLPVGLFLFFIFGLTPLVLALGAMTRREFVFGKVSEMLSRHWSWTGGVMLMAALVLWLLVEGLLIGLDHAATYFTVLMGAVISVMLVLPSSRGYYLARR